MTLTVKLSGHLPWYRKDKAREFSLELDGEPTAREVLLRCAIPFEEVSLVLVDGVRAEWDTRLRDGQALEFFPIISGG